MALARRSQTIPEKYARRQGQLTAQGKLPAAHKGLVHVAKVMAGTAIDAIQDETLLARAKADHQARVARNPYLCPLPPDLEPPIRMSA